MPVDIFSKYATDENLETSGTWRAIGGGTELLIARAGNRAYARLLAKLYDQNKAALDLNDDTADAKSDEIMKDVVARTILLGWRNMLYKGKDLPYNYDNAVMVLGHKDFRKLVQGFAEDQEAYLVKEEVAQGEA